MSLNIPNKASEIDNRAKTDIQRELTGSNPFLKNSWLGALVTAYSNRIFDFYLQLKILVREMFWNTSTGIMLETQAAWFGITRLAATKSVGNIIVTGVDTTAIPLGAQWVSSDGALYESTSAGVIANTSLSVSSITRSGSLVTVTTTNEHNLSSNVPVTISGAVESEYNGSDLEITVTGVDTFTYLISTTPSTPATGTIIVNFLSASMPVSSIGFGKETNLIANAKLTVTSPIVGLDNVAGVDYGAIGGGTDQESDSDLSARFLSRVQNPIAHFNSNAIKDQAKKINGVTRVFVKEVTPAVGQVTVYFMRDNDDDPIPTGSEVTTVKNKLLEIKPANTADADVIVSAPTAVVVNFIFSALSPNTSTVQQAIKDNLTQYFEESPEVGVNILEDAFRSIIFNTVDIVNGDSVDSFTLTNPSGDVTIATNEIGVLGTVTFP